MKITANPLELPNKILDYPNTRIVNGEPTNIKLHPYQVSLEYYSRFGCSGSIINEYHVLTAGHCVSGRSLASLRVRSGSNYIHRGGVLHNVNKIMLHEGYSLNTVPRNDVAIIRVDEPFELSENTYPIKLNNDSEATKPGMFANASGWGTIYAGGPVNPTLLQVSLPFIEMEECQEAFKMYGEIPNGQICTWSKDTKKGVCHGDSGGPLTMNDKLVGIVSWGYPECAHKSYPQVFQQVSYFYDWVQKHIQ